MNQELEYAQMLEVPVSTVSVVKKKNFFRRKNERDDEEIKEQVVDSVNERMGDYVYAEDITLPKEGRGVFSAAVSDRAGRIIFAEIVAACLLAVGIFLTNIFMSGSAINTFIKSLSAETAAAEATYTDFELVSVVSELSDVEISVSSGGVISFTSACSVYPVCNGEVASVVKESNGTYTLNIGHTSSFVSVVSGLTTVYYAQGDSVKGNVPIGYTDGSNTVTVAMYNGGELLNCYSMNGAVPVWNS